MASPSSYSSASPPETRQPGDRSRQQQQQQQQQQQPGIPSYYRIPLLYIEPPLALGGAALLLWAPGQFFHSVSPNKPPSGEALASVRILTDMLAAMHVVFAFTLAVVLRHLERDRAAWRLICSGMLLSDVLHIAAALREYGLEATLATGAWRGSDWVNWGILCGMATVRLGAALGVGLGEPDASSSSSSSSISTSVRSSGSSSNRGQQQHVTAKGW